MRLAIVAAIAALVCAGCSCNPSVPSAFGSEPCDCGVPMMAAAPQAPCGQPPEYAKPGEVWCCVPYEVPGAPQRVCVQEECTQAIEIPAVYETVSEQVLVSEARTEWRRIECENVSGSECWSLVEIPAQYETRTREVLRSPATVRYERSPARFEMTYGAPSTGYRWELHNECAVPANAVSVYSVPVPLAPPADDIAPTGFGSVE